MSNNTNHPQVAPNQANKETTINDALGVLDANISETVDHSVASGNVSLTDAQFRAAVRFNVTGAATAGRTLTVPAIKKLFLVRNASSSDAISVVRGATSISVPASQSAIFYTDGSTDGLVSLASFTGLSGGPGGFTSNSKKGLRVNSGETAVEYVPISYDVGTFLPGVPVAASEVHYVCARAFTLADNFSGSRGYAQTSNATDIVFNVEKNGSVIGTITFAGGSNTATFATSGSTVESFAAGDRLSIVAPGALGTLADVSITFLGTRND